MSYSGNWETARWTQQLRFQKVIEEADRLHIYIPSSKILADWFRSFSVLTHNWYFLRSVPEP